MANNIVLTGMPASGKSTIGKTLSEYLPNYMLLDIDSIIEKTSGMTIAEIFKKHSEDYFRKIEYDTIKLVCSGSNKIISLGGGAFENPDNRATLLKFGKVFYLKSSLDVLYYRISQDLSRPLLQQQNPKEILEKLLKSREENYLKANFIIDTDNKSQEQIAEIILESINESNS